MSDSRDLAHHEQGGGQVATRSAAGTTIPMEQQMEMMRTALTDPNVDPAKAREMFTLMREVQQDARQAEFNRSKIAAIRAMPAIFKRGHNSHLDARYAKFEDMHRAAMPVLDRFGLTLDFRISSEGRNVTVQPILRHENGYVEEGGIMSAPPTQGKGINAVQEVAITASYLKRHSFKAVLNLIEDGEDTDGGPPRDGERLNDRQDRLIVDAQAAADAGGYAEFYSRLNAKDRALLVMQGIHARFGGGSALPAPSDRRQQQAPEQSDDRPVYDPVGEQDRPDTPGDGRQELPPGAEVDDVNQSDSSTGGTPAKTKRTPEEMVEAYETGVNGCKDLDALREYQAEPKRVEWAEKLKAQHPELHKRVVAANSRRYSEIIDSMPSNSGGAGPLL